VAAIKLNARYVKQKASPGALVEMSQMYELEPAEPTEEVETE